jgi:hypothetical protein
MQLCNVLNNLNQYGFPVDIYWSDNFRIEIPEIGKSTG